MKNIDPAMTKMPAKRASLNHLPKKNIRKNIHSKNTKTDDAREALRALIKNNGDDYKGLSELIGRNPSYVQQYIERGTPKRLAEKDRLILARYYGVDQSVLGALSDNDSRGGLAIISKLSVKASAGAGNLDQMESLAGKIAFDPKWLRQFPYDRKSLSIVSVEGDSMLPALSDGDDIMVAQQDKLQRKDGIYVIRMDDTLMVKRLSFGPNDKIDVVSDNPSYSDWRNLDASYLNIVGRVIWVGRTL